jgi:hypothetical protein
MNELKHGHVPHDEREHSAHEHDRRPYCKRAHRSVGFWVAVLLMLAAMVIYVMSDDLGGWHRGQPRQPISLPVGN